MVTIGNVLLLFVTWCGGVQGPGGVNLSSYTYITEKYKIKEINLKHINKLYTLYLPLNAIIKLYIKNMYKE